MSQKDSIQKAANSLSIFEKINQALLSFSFLNTKKKKTTQNKQQMFGSLELPETFRERTLRIFRGGGERRRGRVGKSYFVLWGMGYVLWRSFSPWLMKHVEPLGELWFPCLLGNFTVPALTIYVYGCLYVHACVCAHMLIYAHKSTCLHTCVHAHKDSKILESRYGWKDSSVNN